MKKQKISQSFEGKKNNRIAFHGGSYSLIITVVVLAILIVVNVCAEALPKNLTRFDISAGKLYSITSNTKTVLNNLKDDIKIYWIVQAGKEDDIIENLLNKYDSLSEHVEVIKKNPDAYPTFAQQYTDETVKNNSLVVECGDRNRFIGFDDIYLQEPDMANQSYDNSFDGEGAVTSAIDYVTTEVLPKVFVLEGHGEKELPEKFNDQIEKANLELEKFSLLNEDEVPDDASCVMIYAPENDISPEEKTILQEYTENGGKLLVIAGPAPESELENLYSLLSDYGIEPVKGVVVDPDREHYAFREPIVLLPEMGDNPITKPLSDEHYFPVMPIAKGLKTAGNPNVIPLLTTSDMAFCKPAGYKLTTYEKEEGDIDGPFAVAVDITCKNSGHIVWFSSSEFLGDIYNAYSSGANINLGMNALSSMIGESDAMNIRTKSLNYNYLTISESTSSMLKILMIGVLPILFLGVGIAVVIVRRRNRYEES